MNVIVNESNIVQAISLIPGTGGLPDGWKSYFPIVEATPNVGDRFVPHGRDSWMCAFDDLPYPVQLAVKMINYAVMSCQKTQHMKNSELLAHLATFFSDDELNQARAYLTGR